MIRTPTRASLVANVKNQTLVIDLKRHFPAVNEYTAHNLADSVRATLKRPVILRLSFPR